MPRSQYYPSFGELHRIFSSFYNYFITASSPYGYAAPQVTSNVPVYRPVLPTIITLPKAVSPVRDFQKKTGAPFRDFSV